jgi:hypothetical protein
METGGGAGSEGGPLKVLVNICYTVEGAQSVRIDDRIPCGARGRLRQPSPTKTTTYVVSAVGATRQRPERVTVKVQ